jgi:hypothetical protein
MNKDEFIAQTKIKRNDKVYAKRGDSFAVATVIGLRKDGAQVEFLDTKIDSTIIYKNVRPYTVDAARQIDQEKIQEEIEHEKYRRTRALRLIDDYINKFDVVVKKFADEFPTNPIYILKWNAEDVIQAQFRFYHASQAKEYAVRLAAERGVIIEEVIIEAMEKMVGYLREAQLDYDGVRSTSKMEVFAQECEATARVKMLRDIQIWIGR